MPQSRIEEPELEPLKESPRVSIVIPMYNEKDSIVRCLESVQAQDYPADQIEILVADGLSSDGCREQVIDRATQDPRIRLLDNPQKRTPRALNIGIQNATGDVIIILGAHTKIEKDFVRQNIQVMREKNVPCTGGTQKNIADTFIQQAIGLAMGSPFGIPSAPYRFGKTDQFVDTVVYAAYRRELFDQIGYFDEELLISEDAEFNWRIRKAGHQIYYTPKIVSYYYPRKTVRRLIKQLFRYGILRINVIRKHIDAAKPIHLAPMAMIFSVLLLFALGFINILFWQILIGIGGLYLLSVLAASLITGARHGMRYAIVLPLLFIGIHLSWGLGFIAGIFVRRYRE
jgi:GT2 family glycosyltransferase